MKTKNVCSVYKHRQKYQYRQSCLFQCLHNIDYMPIFFHDNMDHCLEFLFVSIQLVIQGRFSGPYFYFFLSSRYSAQSCSTCCTNFSQSRLAQWCRGHVNCLCVFIKWAVSCSEVKSYILALPVQSVVVIIFFTLKSSNSLESSLFLKV